MLLSVLSPVVLLLLVGELFTWKYKSYTADKPAWAGVTRPITGVILGSSMARQGYNPLVLQKRPGDLVYNLATAGQAPDSSYFVLKDFLQFQRPRWVILDIYWLTLEQDLDFSELARTYDRIVSPVVKRETFVQGFPWKSKIDYLVPLLRYRQDFYWTLESTLNRIVYRSRQQDAAERPSPAGEEDSPAAKAPAAASAAVDYQGYTPSAAVAPPELVSERNRFRTYRYRGFSARPLEYLSKIIALCRQENLPLFVVSAPIMPQSLSFVRSYDTVHRDLEAFLAKNGQGYLDLNVVNRERRWLDETDFQDENHPNARGADIISRRLLELLPLD